MTRARALAAIIVRNLRLGVRRADLVIQTIAVPLVVLGLASIIFGASDAWPIAVVDQSRTAESAKVVQSIKETRGSTGPYFRIQDIDPDTAAEQVREGRLHLVVTIPEDFATSRTLRTTTYNINTDAMKNVRLRLSTMANGYDQAGGHGGIGAELVKAQPEDVTRTAFMGGSAVIFALLLGSALIAANLYAVDHERRTTKEIALTPVGSYIAGIGAMVAGWLLSLLTALPTVGLALLMGTRAGWGGIASAALVVLPGAFAAAGLGVACAAWLRSHRHIQPVIILLALGSYFASGGFISVNALPPLARNVATWWPPAYIFEWANPLLHRFSTLAVGPLVAVTAAALVGLVLAGRAGSGEPSRAHRQGQ